MTVHNFNAGPAVLPAEVIAQIQAELPDFAGTGMSILESSHRSKAFEAINDRAVARLRRILGLPDNYLVGFLQGGASHQFAMIPLNYLLPHQVANYVLTGVWAEKALAEAELIGNTRVVASGKDSNYAVLPDPQAWHIDAASAYLHLTSNNTIYGTQWPNVPCQHPRTIIDMSSDIASRPIDLTNVAMIYAGAQKNLGPAGVTVVIIREDLASQPPPAHLPTILRYQTHLNNKSLYNTPPTFAIYVLDLVLAWIEQQGMATLAQRNTQKAQLIYQVIDQSGGFYRGHSHPDHRSQMNITFTLADATLEKSFLSLAEAAGMVGLAGHRSVGGLRASLYNALPLTSAQALADMMREFQRTHG
jgi:phosphoserine aminotransferase